MTQQQEKIDIIISESFKSTSLFKLQSPPNQFNDESTVMLCLQL